MTPEEYASDFASFPPHRAEVAMAIKTPLDGDVRTKEDDMGGCGFLPDGSFEHASDCECFEPMKSITITLTDYEARQVDWALAKRQSAIEHMMGQEVAPEINMVTRDELAAIESVVHKLAPIRANGAVDRNRRSAEGSNDE